LLLACIKKDSDATNAIFEQHRIHREPLIDGIMHYVALACEVMAPEDLNLTLFPSDGAENGIGHYMACCQSSKLLEAVLLKFTPEQILQVLRSKNSLSSAPLHILAMHGTPETLTCVLNKLDNNVAFELLTMKLFNGLLPVDLAAKYNPKLLQRFKELHVKYNVPFDQSKFPQQNPDEADAEKPQDGPPSLLYLTFKYYQHILIIAKLVSPDTRASLEKAIELSKIKPPIVLENILEKNTAETLIKNYQLSAPPILKFLSKIYRLLGRNNPTHFAALQGDLEPLSKATSNECLTQNLVRNDPMAIAIAAGQLTAVDACLTKLHDVPPDNDVTPNHATYYLDLAYSHKHYSIIDLFFTKYKHIFSQNFDTIFQRGLSDHDTLMISKLISLKNIHEIGNDEESLYLKIIKGPRLSDPELEKKWEDFVAHMLEKNPLPSQQNSNPELVYSNPELVYTNYLCQAFILSKETLLDGLLNQAPSNFGIDDCEYGGRSLLWKAVDFISVNDVKAFLKNGANPHYKRSADDQSPYEHFIELKLRTFSNPEDAGFAALLEIERLFQEYDKEHPRSL
jgi:hypothetical protein